MNPTSIVECLPRRMGGSGNSCGSRILTALPAILVLVLLTATVCRAETSQLSADARRDLELRPGVVQVIAILKGTSGGLSCKITASGTGFLYRPDGYLITNGHVAQLAHTKDDKALKLQREKILGGFGKRFHE